MKYKELLEEKKNSLLRNERELKSIKISLEILNKNISWYRGYDLQDAQKKRERLECEQSKLQSDKQEYSNKIDSMSQQVAAAEKNVKTMFNPLNWFDGEQIEHRKNLDDLKKKIKNLEVQVKETDQKIFAKGIEISQLLREENRFQTFNIAESLILQKKMQEDAVEAETAYSEQSQRHNAILENIQALLDEIKSKESELEKCQRKIKAAEQFDKQLSMAKTSRERARIHERCKKELGEGRPVDVIRKCKNIEGALQRTISKLDKRICSEIRKYGRRIDLIIIDGNNLCYNSSSTFIGVQPVVAVVNALSTRYRIVVCFDFRIKELMKKDDFEIQSLFPKNAEIHIEASKREADYTILGLADTENNAFVISNDKYAEFLDKRSIKGNRIFSFEIVSGYIFVHDLDLELKF